MSIAEKFAHHYAAHRADIEGQDAQIGAMMFIRLMMELDPKGSGKLAEDHILFTFTDGSQYQLTFGLETEH